MDRKLRILLIVILLVSIHIQGFSQVAVEKEKEADEQVNLLQKNKNALNFLVMGDWGRNGEDHQKPVAQQMGKTAAEIGAEFIISTGDNFYPSGVISEYDPLWKYSYEDIYTAFSLQWNWYPVLGNHDYKSNPDAQVAYSKISRRWKMPARYYSKKFSINGDSSQQVLIAFIDTNPLIKNFYWHSEYSVNVKTQDSTAQKKWLEGVLSDTSSTIKWKIVVGHHPMFTGGGRKEGYDTKAIRTSLIAILNKYNVDAYLAGHEHSLQHILPPGKTHHFISGAASERTKAIKLPESKFAASEYGFMTFSITSNLMLVQVIDYKGNIIYTTKLSK